MMSCILSGTFSTKVPINNLILETNTRIIIIFFFLLLLQIICQIGCWDIEWIFLKHLSTIYMFNILIRNNKQFD